MAHNGGEVPGSLRVRLKFLYGLEGDNYQL